MVPFYFEGILDMILEEEPSGIWSLPVDNGLVVYVYDIHNKWFQVKEGSFSHEDKFLSLTDDILAIM